MESGLPCHRSKINEFGRYHLEKRRRSKEKRSDIAICHCGERHINPLFRADAQNKQRLPMACAA